MAVVISTMSRNHLHVSPLCSCSNGNETTDHFFCKCPLFNDQRLIFFFRRTECYHPLSLHALLSGKDNLSTADNDILFIRSKLISSILGVSDSLVFSL